MRLTDESMQRARREAEEARIRAIVREEITQAIKVLARASDDLDRPYETGELESSALSAVGKVMDDTVVRLTCEHVFQDYQPGKCWNCNEPAPEPVDQFKAPDPDCNHAWTLGDDGTRACQLCEGVKTDG